MSGRLCLSEFSDVRTAVCLNPRLFDLSYARIVCKWCEDGDGLRFEVRGERDRATMAGSHRFDASMQQWPLFCRTPVTHG